MKKAVLILVSIFIFLSLTESVAGQCAMCKAVVESRAIAGNDMVEGINSGILYMMGVPYLLMLVIGFAWYKKFGKPGQQ